MVDPVMVDPEGEQGGSTYEREYIAKWLAQGNLVDPLTRYKLKSTKLTENVNIKKALHAFKDEKPQLIKALEDMDRKLRQAQSAFESAAQNPAALVPKRFLDKTTFAIMRKPVRARDGIVYEKRVLLEHITKCECQDTELFSPVTKQPMEPGYDDETALEQEIEAFLDANFNFEPNVVPISHHGSVLDLSNLFSALDGLKDILLETLGSWEPPCLVVFGAESVGKSTLLQRLSLLPVFPTFKTRCTRMPIRLEIRRSSMPAPATLSVWNVIERKYVGQPELISLETIDGSGEKDVKLKMMNILDVHCQGGQVSLDFELHIRATSITLPPMNLVDLPGIVENDTDLKNQTEALLARYVTSPDSRDIFLAVAAAVGTSPANWTSNRLVGLHKLSDRAIGVITKCDRVEDDDLDLLRLWLNGGDIEGLLPLEHGYVGIASPKNLEKKPDESLSGWIRRMQEQEIRTFQDKSMSDCIEAQKVCIQALLERINKMYSWHVINGWLPSTARRLLQVWRDCCEELCKLGLPRSSGELGGSALACFKAAAMSELKQRLAFAVDLSKTLFQSSVVKPMKEYLERELDRLRSVELDLVDVSNFLQDTSSILGHAVPVRNVKDEWLAQTFDALLPRSGCDEFRLQRLPLLIDKVKSNLQDNKPNLDVDGVRKQIQTLFADLFCPRKSTALNVQVDNVGKAKLCLDAEKIVGICLIELANGFKAVTTHLEFEKCIILPALVQQEKETCHQSRERVYERMSRVACALKKLFEMHGCKEDVEAQAELLASWLPDYFRQTFCPLASGDSEIDDNFQEPACNWLTSVLLKAVALCEQELIPPAAKETLGGILKKKKKEPF